MVNGPGEAAQTEIGLTGGGNDNNLLYLSGIPHNKVTNSNIIDQIVKLVEEKVSQKELNATKIKSRRYYNSLRKY